MSNESSRLRGVAAALVLALSAAACSGSSGGSGSMPPASGTQSSTVPMQNSGGDKGSILKMLGQQVVIGSTIDPQFGQLNPYGLDVAKSTNGLLTKGDLVVCNFNANSNVQGTGYTIVSLHPTPNSQPQLIAADQTTLLGCDALALAPNDTIWAAAFVANDNPIFSSSGSLVANLSGAPFNHPFGQAFAQPSHGKAAFYESNAGDGSIVRINLTNPFSFDVIATGFAINGGQPGGILGPSGLNYDRQTDTLYIVDGTNNSVVAFKRVSTIKAGGIVVGSDGKSFSGPSAKLARLVFMGAPLNGPISSALLFNGNLVIGNTLDPDGKNLMVELKPSGRVLDVRNVDTGPAGSLFGMVATGKSAADTKLYFNDDNNNNLQVLER